MVLIESSTHAAGPVYWNGTAWEPQGQTGNPALELQIEVAELNSLTNEVPVTEIGPDWIITSVATPITLLKLIEVWEGPVAGWQPIVI
jgi:hypothetical protein